MARFTHKRTLYDLEIDRQQDIRNELEALTVKYSGRKFKQANTDDFIHSDDAVRYRELLKLLWSLPVPKEPAPPVYTPVNIAG